MRAGVVECFVRKWSERAILPNFQDVQYSRSAVVFPASGVGGPLVWGSGVVRMHFIEIKLEVVQSGTSNSGGDCLIRHYICNFVDRVRFGVKNDGCKPDDCSGFFRGLLVFGTGYGISAL